MQTSDSTQMFDAVPWLPATGHGLSICRRLPSHARCSYLEANILQSDILRVKFPGTLPVLWATSPLTRKILIESSP